MILEHIFTLKQIDTVARATKRFRFTKPDGFDYLPGQFISIKFTEKAFRAYSIASHPDEGFIELLVRIVPGGLGSTVLDKAKIGDDFVFRGAFGRFNLSTNSEVELVFCCTGTGVAPFRSMILEEAKKERPRAITLLFGGRDQYDVAYLDEVFSWANRLHVKLGFSRSQQCAIHGINCKEFDPSPSVLSFENSRITTFLSEQKISSKSEFYICGNGDMVVSVRKILDEAGIDKKRIFQERFN